MKKTLFNTIAATALLAFAAGAYAEGSKDIKPNAGLGDATTMLPKKTKTAKAGASKSEAVQVAQGGDSASPAGSAQSKSVEQRDAAKAERQAKRAEKRGGKPSKIKVTPKAEPGPLEGGKN